MLLFAYVTIMGTCLYSFPVHGNTLDQCEYILTVSSSPQDTTSTEMNIFHQAILTWNLQKPLHQMQLQTQSSHMAPNPIMHKKHGERNLQTPISNLISCRLREGYTIQDVHLTKGACFFS